MKNALAFLLSIFSLIACTNPQPFKALTTTPRGASMTLTPTINTRPIATASNDLAIEEEAKFYPSAPAPQNVPRGFNITPGTTERKCVQVGNKRNVRSGEFVAGNFIAYIQDWKPNPQSGKLYWNPLHSDQMKGLTVKAYLHEEAKTILKFHQRLVAVGNGEQFYPTDIRLPKAGTWRLVATSGPDWGCFELILNPH